MSGPEIHLKLGRISEDCSLMYGDINLVDALGVSRIGVNAEVGKPTEVTLLCNIASVEIAAELSNVSFLTSEDVVG